MGDNLLLGMLFITITAFSQVGVNTTNPLATLDINGNLAIRTVPVETNKDIAKDSILVISTDGKEFHLSLKVIFLPQGL